MPDLNAPAERSQSKTEDTVDFSDKDTGRYKSREEGTPDSAIEQPRQEVTNRYAPKQELGAQTQEMNTQEQNLASKKADVSQLSDTDLLKNEIKRLDSLAEQIDIKLKSPVDMEAVMRDPNMRKMLRNQVQKERSVENLDYLEAIERFEKEPTKEGFKEIYSKYIGNDAASQVNLPSDIRKDLDQKFKNIEQIPQDDLGTGFLEKSRASITKLMQGDSLGRLKQDPEFKKYSDERTANLKEEKLAVVSQSDIFKNQFWKNRANSDVANLPTADQLKSEIKHLDGMVAEIDKKLKNTSAVGMDSVMRDPNMRNMLRNQLGKEFSIENLDYLEAIEKFDRNPSKEGFKEIYDNFVRDDSKSQVNLPSGIRKDLDDKMKNIEQLSEREIGKGSFEKSRDSISNLIAVNSLGKLNSNLDFYGYSQSKLNEQKLAIVAQSDILKSQLWKTHSNGLAQGSQKPLEQSKESLTSAPSHRYAPAQQVTPNEGLKTPDDRSKSVLREPEKEDGYQSVLPVPERENSYDNVPPLAQPKSFYANNPSEQVVYTTGPTEQALYANQPSEQPVYANYPSEQPVYANQPVEQPVYANQPIQQAVYANQPSERETIDGELTPGEQSVNGKKFDVDSDTEFMVDFERVSPLGERAAQILKDLPQFDDTLASDWEALQTSLKNGDTSIEEAQAKLTELEPRVRAVIEQEPQDARDKRQQDTLVGVTLQKGDFLANGNFGVVNKLMASNDMTLVGKSPKVGSESQFLAEAKQEAQVYSKVGDHPNIARCFGIQNVDNTPTLVLENVQGGKLEKIFENLEEAYAEQKINRQEFVGAVQHLVKGSLQGLAQFETMGMVHMDIKSDNIMFDDKTMEAKLVDMGTAQGFGEVDNPSQKRVFINNMAPEFFLPNTQRVNKATDSFGIGKMLFPLMERDPELQKHFQFRSGMSTEEAQFAMGAFIAPSNTQELVSGAKVASQGPKDGHSQWQAIKPIGPSEKWTPGTYGAKTSYVDFMNRMTHPDPVQRLSPSEALKHPFMTDSFGGAEQLKEVMVKVEDFKKTKEIESAKEKENIGTYVNYNNVSL